MPIQSQLEGSNVMTGITYPTSEQDQEITGQLSTISLYLVLLLISQTEVKLIRMQMVVTGDVECKLDGNAGILTTLTRKEEHLIKEIIVLRHAEMLMITDIISAMTGTTLQETDAILLVRSSLGMSAKEVVCSGTEELW